LQQQNLDPINLGRTLRHQAIEHGEQICRCEVRRTELENSAAVLEAQAELSVRHDERERHQAVLRNAADSGQNPMLKCLLLIAIAIILGMAGFASAHLALAPFGLGWYEWPFSAGVGIICAVLTHMFLEEFASGRIVKAVVATTLVVGLTGILVLAQIRADIFILLLKGAAAGAPEGGGGAISAADAAQFYQSSANKLRLFLGLLAIALEIGTGLIAWEAGRLNLASQDVVRRAEQRLAELDEEMPRIVRRIRELQNAPQIVEAEFRRDFYRGLLLQEPPRAVTRIGPIALALLAGLIFWVCAARAETPKPPSPPSVVEVIDLSKSDVVSTHTSDTHKDNIDAAAKTIVNLPAGAKFTVIGMTAASFSRPLILLSGHLPLDPGMFRFINRVAAAKDKYADELRHAASAIQADAQTTDVFGSFLVAADLLRQSSAHRRILLPFSDMRQSAPPVNIENVQVVPVAAALKTAEAAHLIADLKGVEVYVYGVHAAYKDVAYWRSLREFWAAYFTKAGAHLKVFSMLPGVPDFTETPKQ
jgi:hypothetical protein